MQVLNEKPPTDSDRPVKVDEQKAAPRLKIKNSMMNKPCGCGSKKKFKKCCLSKARIAIRKMEADNGRND